MTPVTDWKGNEIVEGMEVCTIRINTETYMRLVGAPEPEIKDCWDIGKWRKVETLNGNLVIRDTVLEDQDGEEYTFNFAHPLSMLTWKSDNQIIAIKGISDNEKEYRNYVNVPRIQ